MHSDWIGSPGMGTTPIKMSKEPLATEGEATLGPDDEINWDDLETAGYEPPDMPSFPAFDPGVDESAFWEW